jgi:ATP-dependent DNA helicase RecG
VVIEQDCDTNGQSALSPIGLLTRQIDKIRREPLAVCQLIQPPYSPVLGVEMVEGRRLIALWA